jgi:tetratricopeptide (TPR) repeat protein
MLKLGSVIVMNPGEPQEISSGNPAVEAPAYVPTPRKPRGLTYLLLLGLVFVTLALFWRSTQFDFVQYDDPEYVTDNYYVKNGLTVEGVIWAFTHAHSANWHPLTWVSHMIDADLFGLRPGGHHAINVIFHAFNTALLFWLLFEMTSARWRSAAVAALFAWHPLHVQSVAWIAERKDVLSAFFALWTLLFYYRYVSWKSNSPSSPKVRSYLALAVFSFACGLMSKPMLVTMPIWLLLLDFWPLNRFACRSNGAESSRTFEKFLPLLQEKIPFIALSAVVAGVTLWAQHGAIGNWEQFPLSLRLANVPVALCAYLQKMVWPVDLAVFYPYPSSIPAWQALVGALLLLLATIGVLLARKRAGFLVVGWFWFLFGLLPVIGLVQAGNQRMADRYTYLPLIGLFIVLVWAGAALLPRKMAALLAVLGLMSCLPFTVFQLEFWRNDFTLFQRATEVTEGSSVAYGHVVGAYVAAGQPDKAVAIYETALRLYPTNIELLNNFGQFLAQQGRFESAIPQFEKAINLDPRHGRARSNLGAVLASVGRVAEGESSLLEAVRLAPRDAEVHLNLANLLLTEKKVNDALGHYMEAGRLEPGNSMAHYRAARILINREPPRAVLEYAAAVELRPDWLAPLTELAWLYATHPRVDLRNGGEALRLATRACKLTNYEDFKTLGVLDAAYAEIGDFRAAVEASIATRNAALKAGKVDFVQAAEYRRSLYEVRQAFRQE